VIAPSLVHQGSDRKLQRAPPGLPAQAKATAMPRAGDQRYFFFLAPTVGCGRAKGEACTGDFGFSAFGLRFRGALCSRFPP
jgi:hypothetical protein